MCAGLYTRYTRVRDYFIYNIFIIFSLQILKISLEPMFSILALYRPSSWVSYETQSEPHYLLRQIKATNQSDYNNIVCTFINVLICMFSFILKDVE